MRKSVKIMRKIRSILVLWLLLWGCCGSVFAQQMPERAAVRRGNRQFEKGNYEAAAERYRRALELAPKGFEATYDLGNALYRSERYEQAEQTLQQAAADTLRTDDERAAAFYNLGNAQFRQQKYKEALESYKNSLRLQPADRETKYNYAYTKRLLQEQEQNGGGGQDQQQDQNQNQQQDQQNQNQDQQDKQDQQDQQNKQDQQQGDDRQQPSDPQHSDEQPDGGEQQQPAAVEISPQEQEQMLDAIQAQEDRTQEKLKEKQGVIVRGKKNW